MGSSERTSLEDMLQLARQIAAQLEPITNCRDESESLCLRLAQAHALGLVDQLVEFARTSQAPGIAELTTKPAGSTDELLRPS